MWVSLRTAKSFRFTLVNVKILSNIWIACVSKVIWGAEKVFFYPKLKLAYQEISHFDTIVQPVIFDVGANKGQSISFFRGVYPSANLYAFEPSKNVFNILQSRTKNDEKTSVYNIGMGSSTETRDFYQSILDETSTFVLPNFKSDYMKKKAKILFSKPEKLFTLVRSEITTIDLFVAENRIGNIDILKIDVEGFEFEVLTGALRTISDGIVNVIQLERHEDDMRDDNFPEIDEFLKIHSYTIIGGIKHPFGNFSEVLYQRAQH